MGKQVTKSQAPKGQETGGMLKGIIAFGLTWRSSNNMGMAVSCRHPWINPGVIGYSCVTGIHQKLEEGMSDGNSYKM